MRKLLILIAILLPLALMAQEEESETMQVRGNIKFVNDAGERVDGPDVLWYGVLDKKVAREAYRKLQLAKVKDDAEREVEMTNIRIEYSIDARAKRGVFKKNAMASMALIFVDEEDGEVLMVDIEKGKTQYKDIVMKLKQTKTVVALGDLRQLDINVVSTDDADDGNVGHIIDNISVYVGLCERDPTAAKRIGARISNLYSFLYIKTSPLSILNLNNLSVN